MVSNKQFTCKSHEFMIKYKSSFIPTTGWYTFQSNIVKHLRNGQRSLTEVLFWGR